jgi:RNA polymerase sigma-70 factor (family 1)
LSAIRLKIVPLYDEQVLLQQVAKGDERSFALLVDHHWNKIYSMSVAYLKSSSLAQDLVQDVFIKVWLKRDELPAMKDFNAWLFILARNALLDALKKNRRITITNEQTLEGLLEPAASTEQHYDFKHLNELLQQGIEQLPAQQKQVFRMSFEQGLSHDEICDQLGIAKQTVKNHLVRALITLRTFLQSNGELFLAFVMSALLFS